MKSLKNFILVNIIALLLGYILMEWGGRYVEHKMLADMGFPVNENLLSATAGINDGDMDLASAEAQSMLDDGAKLGQYQNQLDDAGLLNNSNPIFALAR